MPASGSKEAMSEAEIDQRQQAARSHGAYAFRDRGDQALEQPQRSRLEELKAQVQEREGVLELMQDRAANAVMIVEVITSHIAKEVKLGIPLSNIPILRALPAFMNTAQRALRDLLSVIPDDQDVLEIGERIAKAVEEHESNS
jgi:hypothetical protein